MDANEMKVLCITRKYPPAVGGMENFCYNVFSGISKELVSTKIVALGGSQKNLFWFFPYTIFYVLFNAHKYDALIIGDSLLCFLGIICRIFSKKTKRLIIVYGLDFMYGNKLYQAYLRLFLRKCADEYICISRGTQENFVKWGIEGSKIITPGINIGEQKNIIKEKDAFYSKYDIPSDNIVLITVGRLVKRKGVAWFVENVMTQLKGLPITYLVIGEGNERENIEKIISESELETQVKLLGRVSDEALEQCYANAHVFVMPNISVENDIEGFGIVAVEASLAGLIVLASGIEGIRDAISDGNNGYLLPSEDAECYKRKVIDIINNWDSYEKNIESFREYTMTHYSWDMICKKYVEVLQEMTTQ